MSHGLVSEAFKARCVRSHTREVRARVFRIESNGAKVAKGVTMADGTTKYDLPIVGGTLTADSTDPHLRRLSMTVAGEEWIPDNDDAPLAPFGQFIVVEVRIDMEDGGWSPWLQMGEFPIISHKVVRPDGTSEVLAADWSWRVNEYAYVNPHSWANRSRVEAIQGAVDSALPMYGRAVHASANAKLTIGEEAGQVSSGTGRWDWIQSICDAANLEAFFDRFGGLVIRDAVVDYEGYAVGAGPDIGSVANPVALLKTGQGGSIINLTAEITREGGCNGVIINVIPTASPPKGSSYDKSQYKSRTILEKWNYGAAAWGDQFGRITVQRDKKVSRVTQRSLNDAQMWGQSILSRRRGVIRRLEMDAIPMWWLDPDDKVNVTWAQRMPDGTERVRTETHYVESIEFPLAPGDGPMRIRTRQVVVVELSEPWILDPDIVNPPPPPPVIPDAPDLLAQYNAELRDYPSTKPMFREYGKVTSVVDGDTIKVDVFSNRDCTVPSTITHPDTGVKYSNMRIRICSIQAPEMDWFGGGSAAVELSNVLKPGDRVELRSDQDKSADAAGNPRVWRSAYKITSADSSTDYNLELHMLDSGWAYSFPLSHEPRNTMNRIVHTKLSAYHGRGLFASPSAHYGKFTLMVYPNPEGPDTPAGEYLTLKNTSAAAIDISGWRIGDPSPLSSYVFPGGTVIGAGQTFQIFVGTGTNGGGVFYMGRTTILLNNDFEVAVLHDNSYGGATGKIAAITQCINSVNTPIPIMPAAIRTANPDEAEPLIDLRTPMIDFPGVGG